MSTELEHFETVAMPLTGASAMNVMFPGLNLHLDASRAEIEALYLASQDYTACDTIEKDRFLSYSYTRVDGTKDRVQTLLRLWGCFTQLVLVKGKESVRVILKLEVAEGQYEYIYFVSDVLYRDLLKMLLAGVRPFGDWDQPMYALITRFALPVGQSFRLRFVDPAKVGVE
jgi:hypothetical protein